MVESITVATQLMPNGARFSYEPTWDETEYREEIEHELEKLKLFTVMGRTAEIIRKPGFIEFVDVNPPPFKLMARGIPIQVSANQVDEIAELNRVARSEHRFDDHIDIVDGDGGTKWTLSPFAGCCRIAVNIRSRLDSARLLNCEYRVAKGSASWKGRVLLHVGG